VRFSIENKILFIHTANMGDVVSASGLICQAVEEWGPVDILLRPVFSGLFAGENGCHEVTADEVKGRSYEWVVDLDSSQASRKIVKSLSAKNKVGRFVNWGRRLKYWTLYTRQVPKRPVDHIVRDYQVVAQAMGLQGPIEPRLAKVKLDQNVMEWVKEVEGSGGRPVVVAPEASNPIRSLPSRLVEDILVELSRRNERALLVGLDQVALTSLTKKYPGHAFWRSLNIQQLKTLFSCVETFIGCDSGPMHLAAAMGMELKALFGPTRPENYGPPIKKGLFLEKEFDCRPCNQNKPCPHERRCFNSLEAQDLFVD
jgi:ADP-heptose:LPS heptosyltransferase